MKRTLALLTVAMVVGLAGYSEDNPKWISLFNGKDLSGWTAHGKAQWSVQDGVLVGIGGMGHLYSDATCSDFEAKGMFRITSQGAQGNSGFYFRANPPADISMVSPGATRPRFAITRRLIPDGYGNRASRPGKRPSC